MMCETCGCGDPDLVPIEVQDKILSENDRTARHNREHFAGRGIVAINLMGSPGSGKTAILEATAGRLGGRRLLAISGDLATHLDAERLRAAGIASIPITTGSACHLDADMVHWALHDHQEGDPEMLFIENVGNLVCPAVYDLGQAASVVALSVTEGEDKPLKYPVMFRKADLVLLTKVDLLPHLDVRVTAIEDALARVMPEPRLMQISARTGEGVDRWLEWLRERRTAGTGAAPRAAQQAVRIARLQQREG
jgi:hydrogenase nickel incorporation protein HypB